MLLFMLILYAYYGLYVIYIDTRVLDAKTEK